MHHVGRPLFYLSLFVLVCVGIYSLFFGPYTVQALYYDEATHTINGQYGGVAVTNSKILQLQDQLTTIGQTFPNIGGSVPNFSIRIVSECTLFAYENNIDLGISDKCPTVVWNSHRVRGLMSAIKYRSTVEELFKADGLTNANVLIKRQWWVIKPPPPAAIRAQG